MRLASGTIGSAAEKNTQGAGSPACSSASVTGMKTNNQLTEGLIHIEMPFVVLGMWEIMVHEDTKVVVSDQVTVAVAARACVATCNQTGGGWVAGRPLQNGFASLTPCGRHAPAPACGPRLRK